jgi:drug/metabolite transporter (DMT)-like permease
MNSTIRRPPFPPLLAIAFGILAVSTASIFIRFAQAEAPSLVIAACRLTIASLVLAPFALTARRQELSSLNGRDISLALLSGFFLAIHFATWISSLEFTTVASSAVLVSTIPLFVAILSPLFLKERLTHLVAAGLLLALVGGVVVALSDVCAWQPGGFACPGWSGFAGSQVMKGNLLALAGAAAGACYVIIGRRLRAKVSLLSYIFVVYGMAAIVLVAVMLASGASPFGYSPITYLWFVLLALVPQLIGHTTFNWALGYLSAAFVAITLLGEPVGTTVLAYLILDEIPGFLKISGAVLIFVGIVVASRSSQEVVEQQAALE